MALTRPQPRRRIFYGWWVVTAGSVISAIGSGILWYGFTVFFLPISRDLGLSRASTSLVFSAARLEGGVEGPVVGMILDRVGPRALILAGGFLAGLGFMLLPLAHNFVSLLLIYVLVISLGWNAGFFHAVTAAVNFWFIRHRALALSIATAASGLGAFVLVPLLSFLVVNWGWRVAAMVAGAFIWATVLPAAMLIHRSPESRGLLPDGAEVPPVKDEAGKMLGGRDYSVREALRTPNYWMLTAAITLRMVMSTALVVHLVPLLVWKGMTEVTAATVVSIYALASIGGRLLAGWWGDRASKPLLSAGGAFMGLVAVFGLAFLSTPAAIPLFVVAFTLMEATIPLHWVMVADFFGRKSFGTLRGIMSSFYSLGAFASPVMAGWVFDRTQSYTLALVVLGASIGLGGVFFCLLERRWFGAKATQASHLFGLPAVLRRTRQ